MKQFWLQVSALLVVIFAGFWITKNPAGFDGLLTSTQKTASTPLIGAAKQTIMVTGADNQSKAVLNIDIADTDQKRALGLGGRNSLDQNSGMLFLFDTPKVPQFWMKGMQIPLDIVWINNDTIVGIAENIPAPHNTPGEVLPIYSPATPIDKVLEVNGGFIRQHNIEVGDKLKQVR